MKSAKINKFTRKRHDVCLIFHKSLPTFENKIGQNFISTANFRENLKQPPKLKIHSKIKQNV